MGSRDLNRRALPYNLLERRRTAQPQVMYFAPILLIFSQIGWNKRRAPSWIINPASGVVTVTPTSIGGPEMLSSSSASMVDLYIYGYKTFSGYFEFYIADVILHLKTCGLCVRLRGRILFPSATNIWNLHCFIMTQITFYQNPSFAYDYSVIIIAITHRYCQKLQHTDFPNLISEASIWLWVAWQISRYND